MNEFNTVMPWTMYAGMTESDLSAIYEYLKTLKPVSNKVERFTYYK
ncbi:MAG: cytochrome c, partial [Ignavibacteria bacterium]|nr:cytochrome c [Ignavibacteria bacterium]